MLNGEFHPTPEKCNKEVGEFNETYIFGRALKTFSNFILCSN